MIKSVFMGSPEFALPIMEKLNEKTELLLVITETDKKKGRGRKKSPTEIKKRALELDLSVITPEDINSQALIEELVNLKADLFVVAAYGRLLSKEILSIPKYCINLHASILPKYRGAAPIQRAIMDMEEKTGTCLMLMEEKLDQGPVYSCKEISIGDKNLDQVELELSNLSAKLLSEFIDELEVREPKFTKQEGTASYAKKILNEDLYLDFENSSSKEIIRKVNSLSRRYGAKFRYNDLVYKIYSAKISEDVPEIPRGEVDESDDKILIKTTDGAIEVLEIQAPGKKAMKTEDFLRGNSLNR